MLGVKPVASIKYTDYLIEKMTEHDLLEVVSVEDECELSKWGWEAYYNEIMNGALMLVARLRERRLGGERSSSSSSNALGGFAAARLAGNQMHINNLGVRPACRGRGIGRALLAMTMRHGARLGGEVAHLEVRPSNEAAIGLYLSAGFAITGRRAGYYAQPPEDALLMSAVMRK